jgi:hypothetical protein
LRHDDEEPGLRRFARAHGGFGVTVETTRISPTRYAAAIAPPASGAHASSSSTRSAITPMTTIEAIRDKALGGK